MTDPSDIVAWTPTEEQRRRAVLTGFLAFCAAETLEALHHRSTSDPGWFTEQVLHFLDIRFERPYEAVLDVSEGIEWARWCRGGRLNIVRSCLDRHLDTPAADRSAVVWEAEEGPTRVLSYAELAREVEVCAAGLRTIGIRKGDAVGLHLPMVPETVVALLAVGRVGAVAVPLFSGFGPAAILNRLRDVGAKLLFTFDGFPRRGRPVEGKATVEEALGSIPTLERVVVVRRLGTHASMIAARDLEWDELMRVGWENLNEGGMEIMDAEDPLIVLYSSGTTGRPKGIVHSHCGFPVKAAQDMALGMDVGPETRIAWVTDLGWMMGPWLLYGALLRGASMVLYDGAPDFPGPDRLWQLCAAHRVEVLGVSPTLVRTLMVRGEEPVRGHDLSSLRILASTGEPWDESSWWWLFNEVGGRRIPIINYCGGTEISGGILMGNPLLPLKPCAFPAPCPGMAAEVVDDEGRSIRGEVGELVVRQPWIGMARGFWNDPERYLATYWSRFPGVWVHGDWAKVDAEGHWFVLGRSDDTLKVAGKRVGPAEVESILTGDPSVIEAAVVGVPDRVKGTAMIAFCVPVGSPDPRLGGRLIERVAAALGKPLRPERILFVPALPKTRNAKVMRRVIRAAYLGEDPGDITALEDPGVLETIRQSAVAST